MKQYQNMPLETEGGLQEDKKETIATRLFGRRAHHSGILLGLHFIRMQFRPWTSGCLYFNMVINMVVTSSWKQTSDLRAISTVPPIFIFSFASHRARTKATKQQWTARKEICSMSDRILASGKVFVFSLQNCNLTISLWGDSQLDWQSTPVIIVV